jgi:glycosyltransferase involved in cell wall biosynthesis
MTDKIAGTWLSNAMHANTGYGTQTRQVVSRMWRDGHRVAVAANYGVESRMAEIEGVPHYPRGLDAYSGDMFGPTYDDWTSQHPGWRHHAFVLFDAWVCDSERFDDIPTAIWVPIDHAPAPEKVLEFLNRDNIKPIAMSLFGQQMIEAAGIECTYIPHAIELDTWKPTARVTISGRLMSGREIMGIPEDRWVVGAFNANKGSTPSRKAWGENLVAFSLWTKRFGRDDAVLFIHSEKSPAMAGLDLPRLCEAVGLDPSQVVFINQFANRLGIPAEGMAALMTATDICLASTMGEGFGLTVLEAASTGTRSIVSNFSAQPELAADGFLVDTQPYWDGGQASWFAMPLIESIIEQLEAAYQSGRKRSAKAIEHAANYDADLVYDQAWRPFLASL